jgi:hypothetical protein
MFYLFGTFRSRHNLKRREGQPWYNPEEQEEHRMLWLRWPNDSVRLLPRVQGS